MDGEVFQVVISRRFEMDCAASALDVYRVLRNTNPSPYMYLFSFEDAAGQRLLHRRFLAGIPGNGDRRRGHHPPDRRLPARAERRVEADKALAEELVADAKERAEHLMLVDLARNDLSKVCVPGSVDVTQFMEVERFSHIMHLVSTVVGTLAPDRTAYDVLAATFPAGTLSGAPKPRAMRLLDELEPHRRGIYGGVVGYLDFAGDMDMAIAIRSALLRGGTRLRPGRRRASSRTRTTPPRPRKPSTRPRPRCAPSTQRPRCATSTAGSTAPAGMVQAR